ncbi:hypothetical protein CSKR_107931 [Clonorchis sinensis]|uniref:Uncharacterized protein n=1 Tax=Clonorchis sinensis TaxID=79923 RepID=A0A3R7CB01_CLOSI|nr:hypothetical protein CSKR_107931 [Clonorchis sinensis]
MSMTGGVDQCLERDFPDRKIRGSDPTSASRIPLSRLGQPGSILALVLPSGCMAARHKRALQLNFFMPGRQIKLLRILESLFSPACIDTGLAFTIGFEDLCKRREELQRQIQQDETERARLQREINVLSERLTNVNEQCHYFGAHELLTVAR